MPSYTVQVGNPADVWGQGLVKVTVLASFVFRLNDYSGPLKYCVDPWRPQKSQAAVYVSQESRIRSIGSDLRESRQ